MVTPLQGRSGYFDLFLNQAPLLAWLVSAEGVLGYANRAWLQAFGLTEQQALGLKIEDVVPPEHAEQYRRNHQQVIDTQTLLETEETALLPDGTHHTYLVRKFPVHLNREDTQDDQGSLFPSDPIWVGGMAVDITHYKTVEEDLKDSEARYRLITDLTTDYLYRLKVEPDGSMCGVMVSEKFAQMTGFSLDEVKDMSNWPRFIHPDDLAPTVVFFQDVVASCQPQSTEIRFVTKSGEILWVDLFARPECDTRGVQVVAINGAVKDITLRKVAEIKLYQTSELLQSLLVNSLDGIMIFRSVRDEQGSIIDFEYLLSNPVACQIIGRREASLLGQRLLDVVPGHKADGLFERYVAVVETGQPDHHQFYYGHEGLNRWFENTSVKLGDGFAVSFRDITSLKQSERLLQTMNRQLADRIKELNQRNEEMRQLGDLSSFLQSCLTLEAAYRDLPRLIEPLFPDCAGALFIVCSTWDQVESVASWGEINHLDALLPQSCLVLQQGHCYWSSPSFERLHCQLAASVPGLSTFCLDLTTQGDTLGVLYLSTPQPSGLPPSKQQLARTVGEQMSLAIANLKLRETLEEQSIRDPLTGLLNRRYLARFWERELQKATRHQRVLGVILLDIDHFKHFNDAYGHDAGDQVLQRVSSQLRANIRGSDMVCRYGGEEMLLVLPESSLEDTRERADQLRQAIAAVEMIYDGKVLDPITVSLGVAAFPLHGSTPEDLVKAADQALYQAKQEGRNRVVVAISSRQRV